jgi:hypothetical protein
MAGENRWWGRRALGVVLALSMVTSSLPAEALAEAVDETSKEQAAEVVEGVAEDEATLEEQPGATASWEVTPTIDGLRSKWMGSAYHVNANGVWTRQGK